MSADFYAVILAGGKGERFWPLSTTRKPKQFLSLVGNKPLLTQAVERLHNLLPPDHIYILTNVEFMDLAREAAPGIPQANIIGEPVGRDTAAAIALGAALIKKKNPRGVFCVLTADHVIGDLPIFRQTLRDGLDWAARENVLITMGIEPSYPSSAYGYIETAQTHHKTENNTVFLRARRFVEKPDGATARKYMEAGCYYWNSGMFIWSLDAITQAFARFAPKLSEMINALQPVIGEKEFEKKLAESFAGLNKISIDYAVMEKADNVIMAQGRFAWDDVGSWPALANHFSPDKHNNIMVGDVQSMTSADNIAISRNHVTALVGVSNLIVVQADGVTLVCAKERAEEIKKLLQQMRESGRYEELM